MDQGGGRGFGGGGVAAPPGPPASVGGGERVGDAPSEILVDTSGKFCPVPILEMGKAIQRAQQGQVVRLLATDPGVRSDLPAWCKATRHELLELSEEQGRFQVRVRKR